MITLYFILEYNDFTFSIQKIKESMVKNSIFNVMTLLSLLHGVTLHTVTAHSMSYSMKVKVPMKVNQLPQSIHRASGLPVDTATLTAAEWTLLQPVLEKIKQRMDDWPQLAYYSQANAKLMEEPIDDKRVVFLGDSITEFWNDPKFGGFFPGKPYINRGISAQSTHQMVLRLWADVIALQPKAMVLLAGINDIAGNTGPITFEQTKNNIITIAELATLHNISVVIASVLPTSNYHYDGKDLIGPQTMRRPLEKIRELNAWLKQYCQDHGHIYLDYFSALIDQQGLLNKDFSEDDLHPNKAGYDVMVPLAEAAIAKALSKEK
jgi:lysophospholipase L1-like esterase